jgi:hypothetical protein
VALFLTESHRITKGGQFGHKQEPISKITKAKKDWGCGSGEGDMPRKHSP